MATKQLKISKKALKNIADLINSLQCATSCWDSSLARLNALTPEEKKAGLTEVHIKKVQFWEDNFVECKQRIADLGIPMTVFGRELLPRD